MKGIKIISEKKKITDNLYQKTQTTPDDNVVYLSIHFMKDRFVIEKSFRNDYFGLKELEEVKKEFDTEEKVIEYLGIKELVKNGEK